MNARFKSAQDIFANNNGILRMAEATRAGIPRRTLYAMLEHGLIERISRGVYRLAHLPGLEAPDLTAVAARLPTAVVCLISALAHHELTTQIPHAVDVAIEQGSRPPRVEYPPINIYYFSGDAFTTGVETKTIGGVDVRIYGAEKSIADLFKYRNKLGLDTAIEALRSWVSRRSGKPDTLLEFARICRVEKIIRPYLEALT